MCETRILRSISEILREKKLRNASQKNAHRFAGPTIGRLAYRLSF